VILEDFWFVILPLMPTCYCRHLLPGSVPAGAPPDVLIVESTFGVTSLPRRYKSHD
jgi:hypothetical protein